MDPAERIYIALQANQNQSKLEKAATVLNKKPAKKTPWAKSEQKFTFRVVPGGDLDLCVEKEHLPRTIAETFCWIQHKANRSVKEQLCKITDDEKDGSGWCDDAISNAVSDLVKPKCAKLENTRQKIGHIFCWIACNLTWYKKILSVKRLDEGNLHIKAEILPSKYIPNDIKIKSKFERFSGGHKISFEQNVKQLEEMKMPDVEIRLGAQTWKSEWTKAEVCNILSSLFSVILLNVHSKFLHLQFQNHPLFSRSKKF